MIEIDVVKMIEALDIEIQNHGSLFFVMRCGANSIPC
jgi:hypothetical protein